MNPWSKFLTISNLKTTSIPTSNLMISMLWKDLLSSHLWQLWAGTLRASASLSQLESPLAPCFRLAGHSVISKRCVSPTSGPLCVGGWRSTSSERFAQILCLLHLRTFPGRGPLCISPVFILPVYYARTWRVRIAFLLGCKLLMHNSTSYISQCPTRNKH